MPNDRPIDLKRQLTGMLVQLGQARIATCPDRLTTIAGLISGSLLPQLDQLDAASCAHDAAAQIATLDDSPHLVTDQEKFQRRRQRQHQDLLYTMEQIATTLRLDDVTVGQHAQIASAISARFCPALETEDAARIADKVHYTVRHHRLPTQA